MKKNKQIWPLSLIATILLCLSCANEDTNIPEFKNDNNAAKYIHYCATVSDGNTTNNANTGRRATLNGSKSYEFSEGDKLYVEGTDIYGVLTLTSGAGNSTATFEGNLLYSGSGDPDDELELNAVLVSSSDALHTIINGKVTATVYTSRAIANTLDEAIEKYSHFTATSKYSAKSFTLDQQSAFLNFSVTFTDGTTADMPLSAVIKNGGSIVRSSSVTTADVDDNVVVKFVAAFPAGTAGTTTLSMSTLKLGSHGHISFGGNTTLVKNKIYNITKNVVSLQAVDMGLSVKWANLNIGAANETDYGNYYAWGATTCYYNEGIDYIWANTPYYTGNGSNSHSWSKYNKTDELLNLESVDDAATANLGSSWRMPTSQEMRELIQNTTQTEYWGSNKYNGVNGVLFTSNKDGYQDKSIFLPASGQLAGLSSFEDVGTYGGYWSSTVYSYQYDTNRNYGNLLYFNPDNVSVGSYMRYYGNVIRAVQP